MVVFGENDMCILEKYMHSEERKLYIYEYSISCKLKRSYIKLPFKDAGVHKNL